MKKNMHIGRFGFYELLIMLSFWIVSAHSQDLPAPDPALLTGADLDAWAGDHGDWSVVGDAFLQPNNAKLLAGAAGDGAILNGPAGKTVHLFSKISHGDVRAHIEFLVAAGSNSGVYFMGRYEIQVLDSWGVESPGAGDCGGIYQRWDEMRDHKGYEGHAPRINAALPPGEWQAFDVWFRAPRIDNQGRKTENARFQRVVHNGRIVHENVSLNGPTRASAFEDEQALGPLMLQGDHGPVAYRNIWLAPLAGNDFFAMDTGTRDSAHSSLADQVRLVKELGYDGTDLLGLGGLAEKLHQVDRQNSRLFAVYLDQTFVESGGSSSTNEGLEAAMAMLKGRETILWLPIRSRAFNPSDPAGDDQAVALVRRIADLAAEAGLKVALYPHYDFWLERIEDAVRIAKKADRPNVGVTFNLCHWLRAGDAANLQERLGQAWPYLFMVTLNGADSSGGWNELIQPLDRGRYPVYEVFLALKRRGYTGPIGLQGYGIGGDVRLNLQRSMQAWRDMNLRYALQ